MALTDEQCERYARILFDYDFPNHDSLWETRTDSRKLFYQIPATDVATAARADLIAELKEAAGINGVTFVVLGDGGFSRFDAPLVDWLASFAKDTDQ